MSQRMVDTETPASRLKSARQNAGWRSARKFATELGVDETTYRSHEMPAGAPGARAFNEESAQRYADALNVNWMWLLYGDAVAPMTGESTVATISGVSESQAAAAMRPILTAMGIDADASRPLARALLKAIKAAQTLDDARLKDSHYEIAGALAAQETSREWKKTG